MNREGPWIGVDLDSTLATYEHGQGNAIGEPIPLMMERVKRWVLEGARVKIMTARAAYPELVPPISRWLARYGLGHLEITNQKDFDMLSLWDDRVIQVEANTGRTVV